MNLNSINLALRSASLMRSANSILLIKAEFPLVYLTIAAPLVIASASAISNCRGDRLRDLNLS